MHFNFAPTRYISINFPNVLFFYIYFNLSLYVPTYKHDHSVTVCFFSFLSLQCFTWLYEFLIQMPKPESSGKKIIETCTQIYTHTHILMIFFEQCLLWKATRIIKKGTTISYLLNMEKIYIYTWFTSWLVEWEGNVMFFIFIFLRGKYLIKWLLGAQIHACVSFCVF